MGNVWLVPMDFETCNFEQMKEEWNEKKKIMWQAPGTPQFTKKNKLKINENSMAYNLKKGDVIYLYVTNLPSASKAKLSRILLRGVIEDEPCPMEKKEVYIRSNETTKIYGFSIGNISSLKREYLSDNRIFSLEHLNKIDASFQHPQGPRWPDANIKKSLSNNLIMELENKFKNSSKEDDFMALINHFNKKCFFYRKDSKNHTTFVRRNGLDYFEYHHFIPKHKGKECIKLGEIINLPANGLFLCSNCHNQMHYGSNDEVNNMLKIVLEDVEIKKMLKDCSFQSIIGEDMDVYEWFQETYNSKEV